MPTTNTFPSHPVDDVPHTFRPHYVEYLSFLVTHNSIDPINLLNADDLESIVRRANKRMPPRPYGMVDGIYREYLLQVRAASKHDVH